MAQARTFDKFEMKNVEMSGERPYLAKTKSLWHSPKARFSIVFLITIVCGVAFSPISHRLAATPAKLVNSYERQGQPNKKDSLLVAISFHYKPERLPLLKLCLENYLLNYRDLNPTVVLHTNSDSTRKQLDYLGLPFDNFQILLHENLTDPFDLTWQHRELFVKNLDSYSWFLYAEDDMYIPYENVQHYMATFHALWPKFVPSFLRIEFNEGVPYVVDIWESTRVNTVFFKVEGVDYVSFSNPYHAFWILPSIAIKSTIAECCQEYKLSGNCSIPMADFLYRSENKFKREFAAAYPSFQLKKKGLIRLDSFEKDQVDRRSLSYHLPNKNVGYDSPFGRIALSHVTLNTAPEQNVKMQQINI